jgi:IS30 family transposase
MKDYMHLSSTDRRRLYVFLEMKLSISEIAKRLSRHRSTIYREIERNKEEGAYLPGVSQLKREERAKASHPGKLETNGILRAYVIQSLKKGWSPEQISGRMKFNKLSYYACPETLYQFIYQSKTEALYSYLPYKRPKRRKRQMRKERLCRYGERRLITKRPENINTRKGFGHWEGDTIEFRGTKEKVVTTLVERKSRVVYLLKNESKHSQGVMSRIKGKLGLYLLGCVKPLPSIRVLNLRIIGK